MRKILLLGTVLILPPTLAAADSATVPSGVRTEITTHMRYDSQCRPDAVMIRVITPPQNGTVTSEQKSMVVSEKSERGIQQQTPCVGRTMQGVAVYYQSNPGFTGQDSFRYQRINPRDSADRFNTQISYTVTVVPAAAQLKSDIEKVNAHFAELFNKGDAAGVAALYADDAVVLPPGAGIVKGRMDIQAFWQKAAETLGNAQLTTVDVKALSENAIRETGHFSLRTKSTPPKEVTGKYVVVWERIDGEWKLGTDIWNEGK